MATVRHTAQGFSNRRAWRRISAKPSEDVGCVLRVFQYNVLADSLAEGSDGGVEAVDCVDHFRVSGSAGVHYYKEPMDNCHVFRTSQQNLQWDRRLPMLLQEISSQSPDIICLQEVDHFPTIQSALESTGYSGRFFKKKGRNINDGSAIFWRLAVLKLDSWRGFHLGVNVMTALVVRLITIAGAPVVVCSTHLKAGFSPEMEQMRSKQVAELRKQVAVFAGSDAVILGADLNAHCAAYRRCTGTRCSDPDDVVEPLVVPYLEASGFRSAYGTYPSFTTWGGWLDRDVKATLDYIMLAGPVTAFSAWDLPADDVVANSPDRLPNESCPSDHLCLAADVCLQVGEHGSNEEHSRTLSSHAQYDSVDIAAQASAASAADWTTGGNSAPGKRKSKGKGYPNSTGKGKSKDDGYTGWEYSWDSTWSRSWSGAWNADRANHFASQPGKARKW